MRLGPGPTSMKHDLDDEKDPSIRLKGTIWDTTFSNQPLRTGGPTVRFFHGNASRIHQPSHAYIDRLALQIHGSPFFGAPEMNFGKDEWPTMSFGGFDFIDCMPRSITLSSLEDMERRAIREAARG